MRSQAVRLLSVAMFLGACGGPSAPARDTTPAATAPAPAPATAAPATPDAAAGGSQGDLAALDIEMDEGNDGVAALVRASLAAGCKVQQKEEDGNPSVIADCPEGLFGAVQVGSTLSIRCVDMAVGDCEMFVLSILDGQKAGATERP